MRVVTTQERTASAGGSAEVLTVKPEMSGQLHVRADRVREFAQVTGI